MKKLRLTYLSSIIILMSSLAATGAPNVKQTAHTTDSTGGATTSPSYQNTSVTGLGQPAGFMTGETFVNHGGFLHPTNELTGKTVDSDGDGLTDWEEMSGSAFDPSTPCSINQVDSDNDGFSDKDEALLGSNPLDADSQLRVRKISQQGGTPQIQWQGRQGRQYEVIGADALEDLRTHGTILATVIGGQGEGAWQVANCSSSDTNIQTKSFYSVRLREE